MRDRTPIKIIALIVIPLLIAAAIRFTNWGRQEKSGKGPDKNEKNDLFDLEEKSAVKVRTTWLLPDELREVSGIAWLDTDRFACVQDEVGKIFIFNMRLNKVDTVIPFAGKGDYEGIAVAGNTIYVLRADGVLFGVSNYSADNRSVRMYKTHLTKKQDSESLAYDKKNDRLLIAVKASDPVGSDYKGIYAFDLKSKSMPASPVYKIDLKNAIFSDDNEGKPKNSISPSDIDIQPGTGNIYILEGTKPKLLIMSPKGALLSLHKLKGPDFPQPEGLSFSPDGKMFISNEGNKDAGNILQVEIVDK